MSTTVTPNMGETMHVLHCCCERDCKAPAKFFVDYNGALEGHPQLSIRKGFCEQHASDWMMTRATTPMMGEEELARAMRAFYDAWPWFRMAWERPAHGEVPSTFDDLPPEPFEAAILSRLPAAGASEVERLRRDCAELYQVLGTLDELVPEIDHDAMVKALDNASAAANGEPRPHDDLLPFVLKSLQPGAPQSTERNRALEEALAIAHDRMAALEGVDNADLCAILDAASAIRAMKGSDGWRPMSEAPKDGTKIDLFYPGIRGRTINCFWSDDPLHVGWFWKTPKWGDQGTLLSEKEWNWNCYPNMEPTHWMPSPPRPSPPDQQSQKRGG